MAISFSTVTFTVGSGTETTASLYTWINTNQNGKMTRSGSEGSYVYTFTGNYVLNIAVGATFNMATGDTIQWALTANTVVLDIRGEFNAVENCILKGYSATAYEADLAIYGKLDLQGTSGNTAKLQYFDEINFYNLYGTVGSDWDWAEVSNFYGTTNASLGLVTRYSTNFKNIPCTFDNVTLTGADNGVSFTLNTGNLLNFTFNNITSTNVYNHFQGMAVVKFSNSSFTSAYNYAFTNSGMAFPQNYQTSRTDRVRNKLHGYNQPKVTFDTCTFSDNYNNAATKYNVHYMYGCVVKFKDCTFSNANYGLLAYNDSTFLFQGTTTNTCTTPLAWSYGTVLHVRALTMTVKDISGNAIDNATVFVNQSQDYESHMFLTNSSGQVKDCFGDDPVFAEKEQTAAATYVNWSDSIASGRYHTIHVYADGYQPWTKNVEFTADRTVDATLYPIQGIRAISQT